MRTTYENQLAERLTNIADTIIQEPRIRYDAPAHVPKDKAFKTPDIIATGPNALIECTELMPAYAHVEQGRHHACGPDSQCLRLYDKLAHKISKYREIVRARRYPYVVAINNLSCGNGHEAILEVLFGK